MSKYFFLITFFIDIFLFLFTTFFSKKNQIFKYNNNFRSSKAFYKILKTITKNIVYIKNYTNNI
tara:strand:+ start:739 stop:930 length:192 start_codon:yes stop_codon:yes gene_type:complete